jgi:pimeloyl-ACP methyl ester carboxylesterase
MLHITIGLRPNTGTGETRVGQTLRRGISVIGFVATCLAVPSFGQPTEVDVRVVTGQTTWTGVPEQVKAQEGFVDVGGANLWYWDTGGDGEPVVLVHPYSGSGLIWGYQQPALAHAGYRVIGYSRRGHYQSDVGSPDNPGTGVDDLFRLIEHLDLEEIHLVGLAAGADILPDFAVSHPDHLLSLAIGCTIGRPGDPQYRKSDDVLLPREFRALPAWLKELSPAYRAGNPEGTIRWRELEEISKQQRVPVPAKNVVTPERIASIDIPVLLFTGDSDLYMPPSRLRAYASYWNHPELVVFTETGHAPYWEQPDGFNRVLIDFLSRNGRDSTGGAT